MIQIAQASVDNNMQRLNDLALNLRTREYRNFQIDKSCRKPFVQFFRVHSLKSLES